MPYNRNASDYYKIFLRYLIYKKFSLIVFNLFTDKELEVAESIELESFKTSKLKELLKKFSLFTVFK